MHSVRLIVLSANVEHICFMQLTLTMNTSDYLLLIGPSQSVMRQHLYTIHQHKAPFRAYMCLPVTNTFHDPVNVTTNFGALRETCTNTVPC